MRWLLSKAGKQVWDLMETSDGWHIDEYCIRHRKAGVQLWIANGACFLQGTENTPKVFNLIDRLFLWGKINHLVAHKLSTPPQNREEGL